jgi:hypothetical protein
MWLRTLLAISLLGLSGCVTRREVVRLESEHFMLGWIHGQGECADKLTNYFKFIFEDSKPKSEMNRFEFVPNSGESR